MSDQGAGGQDGPEVERCHGLGERAGEHTAHLFSYYRLGRVEVVGEGLKLQI